MVNTVGTLSIYIKKEKQMASITLVDYGNTPEPYPKTHGILQVPDGSLVIVNCVPAGELADSYYEKCRTLPQADHNDAERLMGYLRSVGFKVKRTLRMRRAGYTRGSNKDNGNDSVSTGDSESSMGGGDTVQEG